MVAIMGSKTTCTVVMLVSFAMLIQVSEEQSTCTQPEPRVRKITEKDGNGTHIFISLNAKDATYTFDFPDQSEKGGGYFKAFFNYILTDDIWVLQLKKPMERALISSWGPQGVFVSVNIHCTVDATNKQTMVPYSRLIHLRQSDEFDIEFTNENVFTVREDTPVGSVVARMDRLFTDKDFTGKPSIVNYFLTNQYQGILSDGGPFFEVKQNGETLLTQPLDYEMGNTTYGLVVAAEDFSKRVAEKSVEVRVVNINDNPPMFVNTGCLTECNTSYYSAIVSAPFVGPLTTYTFGPIQAVDADGDSAQYTFIGGTPEEYRSYVSMDKDSGNLSIIKPFAFLNPSPDHVDIRIQAKSVSTLDRARNQNVTDLVETSIQLLLNHPLEQSANHGCLTEPANVFLFLLGTFIMIDLTLCI